MKNRTMMRNLLSLLWAIALVGCAPGTTATTAHDEQPAKSFPAFLPDVKSGVMTSSASKRTYQISVAAPDGYSKEHAPYPTLYAVDANAEFGTVVEAARLGAFLKEIPDVVIVGIGYPIPGIGFKASGAARAVDLTPTRNEAWVKQSTAESQQTGLPGWLPNIRWSLICKN
jgi:hypothetical protein